MIFIAAMVPLLAAPVLMASIGHELRHTISYPAGVLPFGLGVMRWTLRVEAYMLLLTDEYPPFAIE